MAPQPEPEPLCVGDKRPAPEETESYATSQRVRHERTEPESAWATLPLVAMELLFSYALVDLTVKIDPIPMMHHRAVSRRVDDAFSLRKWSGVCRGWQEAIEQLIAQYQDGTVTMDFILKHEDELVAKLAKATPQNRHMVMDLRVGIYRHINQPIKPTLTPIDWKLVLGGLANLQRLDLSRMNCLPCEDMCAILDAASRCCPKLRALVLPLPHGWIRPPCLTFERRTMPGMFKAYKSLLASLTSALQRWDIAGGASGSVLEHLVFPCMGSHADEFISLVTRFAPRIQVLDAWKLTYFSDGWDDVRCDEHWHMSPQTWEAFCNTCTNLREFNLGLVPPTEAFMAQFTKKTKWLLKELTINYTKCSAQAFTSMSELEARIRQSLGEDVVASTLFTNHNLSSLVQALPRLEILRVNLPSGGEKNLSAFDDDFFTTLEKSCPNLKKLFIAGGRGYSGAESMMKVTERGLAALGDLPKLEEIALRPLKTLTEKGVAKLLAGTGQVDVKLMFPSDVSPLMFKPLLDRVVVLVESGERASPFAMQLAVQESKQRPRYNPHHLLNSSQSAPLCELLDALRGMQQRLLEKQSRLRFQAFVDQHTSKLTQINVFTTDWRLRDGVDTLFMRTEIVYDDSKRDSFEWIVTN